jgi:putative NADH-flavin reductase
MSHRARVLGHWGSTMRLFLLGATGKTGAQLLDLALPRGHAVTAFVRSPTKIHARDPRLAVVPGDPHDVDALARALPGHDAVISALGVRPPAAFRPHSLVEDCAASTVAAMTRAGVRRILLVSAAAIVPLEGITYHFFQWILKHITNDLAAAEAIVRATPFDWTIARPPRLTGGVEPSYRLEPDALPAGGSSMSYRALATFLLDAVEAGSHFHQVVGLAR